VVSNEHGERFQQNISQMEEIQWIMRPNMLADYLFGLTMETTGEYNRQKNMK
jgi:hypothetical protein